MEIKIKSGKHLLQASIHKSKTKSTNNLALILPGFLDSKDYPHLIELGKDLVNCGYTAVRFDPTGVWNSEGNIKAYTISQYLKDIGAVIHFMKKQNQKDYEKIIVLGHSLGGMIAILYSIKNQEIKAVVAIMTPPSQTSPKSFQEPLKEWKKNKKKISYRVLPNHNSKEKKFIVPYSYVIDAKKYDVRKIISKLKQPLILIAGKLDDKVRPEEIKEIYHLANKPKEFILLKNTEHDYRLDINKVKFVNSLIIKSLNKYGLC